MDTPTISSQTSLEAQVKLISVDALQQICQTENTALVDNYRQLKHRQQEAGDDEQRKQALTEEIMATEDYQKWLKKELKRDERRKNKRVETLSNQERVGYYIWAAYKGALLSVILTATFREGKNRWGKQGYWREQKFIELTGIAVLDIDHLPNAQETARMLVQKLDCRQLGILWIFITPSGEGFKVAFKANMDGNLMDNAYDMAQLLSQQCGQDLLPFTDAQCKNADHTHFTPKYDDILYADWEGLATYRNPEYEARYGEAYRRGESDPTKPRWQELERQRSEQRKGKPTVATAQDNTQKTTVSTSPMVLSEREQAIVKALNGRYGETIAEGHRHETWLGETAPWLLLLTDNNADKTLAMGRQLNYVKNWKDQTAGELENCVATVQKKPLLRRRPKALAELLEKAGIDKDLPAAINRNIDPMAELPFDHWCDEIEALFTEFPCLREVCQPHPRRLWPFLLFASAAMMGTCMTLTYYKFYANKTIRCRLNYIILGVGDPASGKGTLSRLQELLLAPIIDSDTLADAATNAWKEMKGNAATNHDTKARDKIYNRMFGPRASNTEFIRSMINCKTMVDGEEMNLHLITVDSEKDNSINMSKSGGWQNRDIMVLKSFHNEFDSQHYSNNQSVSGRFRIYWNQIETCTPPTLKRLVNERNFNSGFDTRCATIPMGKPDFDMMPLESENDTFLEKANETLKQWAYKLDQRSGELPLWPLVEHVHKWCDERRAIAEFNDKDQADWLLIKRVPYYGINVSAPYIDIRHWQEREETGTYQIDDTDRRLCDLVLDIQYRTQLYWYYDLHRLYYDNQLRDAAQQRRRTNKFVECFRQLPDEFTTEKFAQVFGYANNRAGQKTLERLVDDKAIERTMRGNYKKLVSELPTI